MTALFALIRKDLLIFLGDRRALLFSLVIPVVLGAFMGYIFGGSGKTQNAKIEIGVVLEDDSKIAAKIVEQIRADTALTVKMLPLEEARSLVRKGSLKVAVQIPEGFGEAAGAALFSATKKPVLPIFYDPSQGPVLAMAKGILTQHVMQIVSAEMFSGESGQKMIESGLAQLEERAIKSDENNALHDFLGSLKKFQNRATSSSEASGNTPRAGGLSMPFETRDEEMSSETKFNGYGHAFAGMGVQFILMMSIDFGVGILLARRMGLWSRLLAAPISLYTVLAARMLSGAIIAFSVFCVIYTIAMLAFGVVITNMAGFLIIGAAFALMTSSFGLLIAAFGRTPEAARGIAVFATLIMVMLGGAWIPSFMFPAWVLDLTLYIPTRWAIDGISGMTWRAQGFDFALEAMGVLLAFAAAFSILALWKFGRDAKRS